MSYDADYAPGGLVSIVSFWDMNVSATAVYQLFLNMAGSCRRVGAGRSCPSTSGGG